MRPGLPKLALVREAAARVAVGNAAESDMTLLANFARCLLESDPTLEVKSQGEVSGEAPTFPCINVHDGLGDYVTLEWERGVSYAADILAAVDDIAWGRPCPDDDSPSERHAVVIVPEGEDHSAEALRQKFADGRFRGRLK